MKTLLGIVIVAFVAWKLERAVREQIRIDIIEMTDRRAMRNAIAALKDERARSGTYRSGFYVH